MQGWRITNTWTGDLARLVTLEAVIKEMQENNLVAMAKQTGDVLLSGLKTLAVSQILIGMLRVLLFAESLSQADHECTRCWHILCCGLS